VKEEGTPLPRGNTRRAKFSWTNWALKKTRRRVGSKRWLQIQNRVSRSLSRTERPGKVTHVGIPRGAAEEQLFVSRSSKMWRKWVRSTSKRD